MNIYPHVEIFYQDFTKFYNFDSIFCIFVENLDFHAKFTILGTKNS